MGGSGNTYVLNDKSNLTSENWFILFAEKLQNFQPAGLLIAPLKNLGLTLTQSFS